jgi:hypothetical protein
VLFPICSLAIAAVCFMVVEKKRRFYGSRWLSARDGDNQLEALEMKRLCNETTTTVLDFLDGFRVLRGNKAAPTTRGVHAL